MRLRRGDCDSQWPSSGVKGPSVRGRSGQVARAASCVQCQPQNRPVGGWAGNLRRALAKLAGGSQPIHQPACFVAGIARMMLHEQLARSARERKVLSLLSWAIENRNRRDEVSQIRHDALDHCLEQIEVVNRNLLERYYSGSASERIRNRQTLADEFGVGLDALRNRALRLRRQLERCMSGQIDELAERDSSRLSVTHRDKRSG